MAHGTLNIYELAQRVIDIDFYGARDAGETVRVYRYEGSTTDYTA